MKMVDTDGLNHISFEEFQNFWRTDSRFKRLQLSDTQSAIVYALADFFKVGSGGSTAVQTVLIDARAARVPRSTLTWTTPVNSSATSLQKCTKTCSAKATNSARWTRL